MTNPIPRSSLFMTPDSLEHLDEMIKGMSPKDRALAYRFTMHAFNLAHKLVEDEKMKEFA